MSRTAARLTQVEVERLRDLLRYDPDSGEFTWCVARGNLRAGCEAGTKNTRGYIVIKVDRRSYGAHRLAWLYMTGSMPPDEIDHIDMDRSNNRWSNLRAATTSQNQANRKKLSNNASGIKGVSWHKRVQKWQVRAMKNGRHYSLGYTSSLAEAKSLYENAAQTLFGSYARVD
ncbi:MAG: HNH endonuclease [Xanthobacteraceae bacterium]|nr:HNH endonuclease [Xanthobacteraceae bacterium]